MNSIWLDDINPQPDDRGMFRGCFTLERDSAVEIRILGASWFRVWLDGDWLCEGPVRFEPGHPEWQVETVPLPPGEHVLAVHVIYEGVVTKRMPVMPPFLNVEINGGAVPLRWKCRKVEGQLGQTRRINGDCGWIDWQDTRRDPDGWHLPVFGNSDWLAPAQVDVEIAEPIGPTLASVRSFTHDLSPIGAGVVAEMYGYELTDPAVRFYLRDLKCETLPAQGVWRRYDLGRVRLGNPRFILDLPAGAVVEFAYCELLRDGRVVPWVPLTIGASCQIDHYVARGGPQEFYPQTPKGARYIEVHVFATDEQVHFLDEAFVERGYYGEALGSFHCDDEQLNDLWKISIETLRACAEDAIVDCPSRERCQWTGDAVVAMETASVAYADLQLIRRALVQSAQCAGPDGRIVCMSPVYDTVATTYALQWVGACVRYHQLTGDRSVLDDLFECATRNLAGFEPFWTAAGLSNETGWSFVDWGYVVPPGPIDPAQNLHYLNALRAMAVWCDLVGRSNERALYANRADETASCIRKWIDARLGANDDPWNAIGWHVALLALGAGLFSPREEASAIAFVKIHMEAAFPNRYGAPRLSDPYVTNRELITPYFAHYAFPPLIERGEGAFVNAQYRSCWGWMLSSGFTTCLEVFDTRWSHCHQWSACPAWQLSRYALGLHPRFELGFGHFDFHLRPGDLKTASGALPLRGGSLIKIAWTAVGETIEYTIASPEPIWLHFATGESIQVDKGKTLSLPR